VKRNAVFGCYSVRIFVEASAILTETLCCFPQYPESNAGILPGLISDLYFPNPYKFINHPTFRHYIFYLSVAHSPFLDHGRFCSFLILYRLGRTPWTGDQPVARPLPTHRTTQTQNKRIQTSMPWVGFELTIPTFKPAKTIHALDRAATLIGSPMF
jgi:hypothetical protein